MKKKKSRTDEYESLQNTLSMLNKIKNAVTSGERIVIDLRKDFCYVQYDGDRTIASNPEVADKFRQAIADDIRIDIEIAEQMIREL